MAVPEPPNSTLVAPEDEDGRPVAGKPDAFGAIGRPWDGQGLRLSAIIPCFNHGRFLPAALDALLLQEPGPDEIIVVNDASTDDTADVIERYGALDRRVIGIRNAGQCGALVSLQKGLEAAGGHYAYLGAADDVVMPGFFLLALAELSAHPQIGLFCADTLVIDGRTGARTGVRPVVQPVLGAGGALAPATVIGLLRRSDNFILTGSAVFRRDLALSLGGLDPRAGSFADSLLMRRIAVASGLVYRPQAVAKWNVWQDSLSRTMALDARAAARAALEIPALLRQDPVLPAWYAPLFERRWRFGAARLAVIAAPPRADVLSAVAGGRWFDRTAVSILSPCLGWKLGRLTTLAWLTLRYRPFSLLRLLLSAWSRRRRAASR